MGENSNIEAKNEIFNREIYRLFVFYKQLVELLETCLGGYFTFTTDEMNRNYLRLCVRIREILEKPGFEDLNEPFWRPFDNLKDLDPDAPDVDWTYSGSRICGNFSSIVEEFFISAGEKKYPLSNDDLQLLSSIKNSLAKYRIDEEAFNKGLSQLVEREVRETKNAKLKEAKGLFDELNNLTEEEKETLKNILDDIVEDNPETAGASTKFKKLIAKAGRETASGLLNIIVNIASETAKKIIFQ